MARTGFSSRFALASRLVGLAAILALVHPATLRAQEDDTYTPAQRAEIRAVPLTMDLARRANGATNGLMKVAMADRTLQKAMFATMGSNLDAVVKLFDAQPKIIALVHGAGFASVRDYEVANMAFITSYFVANAYPGENLDPNHLTSPAQVAFVRSHLAELNAMMSEMPLIVPHTSSPK